VNGERLAGIRRRERLEEGERAVQAEQELARRRACTAGRPQDRRGCGAQTRFQADGQEGAGASSTTF
jgi:hypothetical protein